jgi:hypothetical protein
MQPVPLFGSGVYGKSAVVTRQRRVNCYYENRADGDKAKVVVYGTPGLVLTFNIAQPSNLPLRALQCTNETALYAVQYNQFLSLSPSGGTFFAGNINTIAGLCSLASNPAGSQIVLVDGSQGWVYQPGAGTFTQLQPAVVGWFVNGAQTVTNVGGYFVTEYPGTGQFGVSNINDATAGNALSVATAAAFPDIVTAVDNLGGNLIIFGNIHTEFWTAVGTPPPAQPFAPIQSATNQWGLAAVFSRQHIDNALLFLGKTSAGTKRVCRIDGYVVTPISEEIDYIINQPQFVVTDAVGLSYQRDKHPFYQITFPTMQRTFLFDLSTGIPCEVQSGLSTGNFQRHQGNLSSYYGGVNNGDTLITDYQNGNVYTLQDTAFTDNGVAVLREVITRHSTKGFNKFRVPLIYLDMETGVGLSGLGQGSNPQVSIECSKDNGRTWLAPRLIPLGQLGQYITRVVARRFGQARVFTFRIRMTDPVKFVITDGAMQTKMKRGGTK